MRLPGPFALLVGHALPADHPLLIELLAALPESERFVATSDGNGLDSTRWPERHNAALAAFAARLWPDESGLVRSILTALEAGEDPRALDRPEWRAPGVFITVGESGRAALMAHALCGAFSREGNAAYFVHRSLPSPTAALAATAIKLAIEDGAPLDAILGEAIRLARAMKS